MAGPETKAQLRARSIFVNCPFDAEYKTLFDAIIFTVVRCGFVARCALEVTETTGIRISRIAEIIRDCDHSIHDLSRMGLYGNLGEEVPRFNMPFELGLFLGSREFGGPAGRKKSYLVLDTERHRYKRALSDIGGQDAEPHDDNVETAIERVRNYLDSRPITGDEPLPGVNVIKRELDEFEVLVPSVAAAINLDPDRLTFSNRTQLIAKMVTAPNWRDG